MLLAFTQTRAILALAFAVAATATLAVLVTVGAMLGVSDDSEEPTGEKLASERQRRALRPSGDPLARRRTRSRETPLPDG